MLLKTITTLASAVACLAAPAVDVAKKNSNDVQFRNKRFFDYQTSTIRGVNIGGWLVLEPYITPSLFEAFGDESNIPVDEYNYHKVLGKEEAASRLQAHWSTFYTEEDFANIAAAGLNTVRIPVGYWAFALLHDDPYVQGQEQYLDQAIQWCRNHNLKVWVDIHGMPGCQNGFDNSGLRDNYWWQSSEEAQTVTYEVVNHVLRKYGAPDYSDVVIGVEVVNEPLGPVLNMGILRQLYESAYSILREAGDTVLVLHDAFEPFGYWNNDLQQPSWGVLIDHHHYQVFSVPELQRNIDEHIQTVCEWGSGARGESHWNVAGEWSAALTDCTKWLNGVGRGSRYDGTFQNSTPIGSCQGNEDISTWSEERKQNTRRYIEAQLDQFETTGGWISWTYKTETSIEWDFQRLAYNGLFPQPLTDRKFPRQC